MSIFFKFTNSNDSFPENSIQTLVIPFYVEQDSVSILIVSFDLVLTKLNLISSKINSFNMLQLGFWQWLTGNSTCV